MTRLPRLALGAALALALALPAARADNEPPEPSSNMDGRLFYQLLLGELNAREGEPGAGFSLMLDAARRTNDPALYQRAVEIAFQARSGESALQAARAWKQAYPASREANRFLLQILLAMGRVGETTEPLKTEIALAEPRERNAVLGAIARGYERQPDKKLVASVVEQAVADYLNQPATAAAAWTTVGRTRLAAGDSEGALAAAEHAQLADAAAEPPALLALELMDNKVPQAEALVHKYLDGKPRPEVRMGYARALLDTQRYAEASRQLQLITAGQPEFAEAWLVQGTLQVQDNQLPAAEASLKRYVELAQPQHQSEERSRGLAQAYLSLSQIAEKRRDYTLAGAWLDRIDSPQELAAAQSRRASLLARQGRLEEGRQLIRALPERGPADARMKITAEAQLLRDHKQYKPAYELLAQAVARDPKDIDLQYDQAMLAEKMGDVAGMEELLRAIIAAKPDAHHAYNALGYSLADRNTRLPEAKQLIQKALELAPGDPFISDSLGWVEFRLGNQDEAIRILDAAYKNRPDPEIAAHLGEVLWSAGQRERAQAIWREGLLLGNDNEILQETLKRLKVKP